MIPIPHNLQFICQHCCHITAPVISELVYIQIKCNVPEAPLQLSALVLVPLVQKLEDVLLKGLSAIVFRKLKRETCQRQNRMRRRVAQVDLSPLEINESTVKWCNKTPNEMLLQPHQCVVGVVYYLWVNTYHQGKMSSCRDLTWLSLSDPWSPRQTHNGCSDKSSWDHNQGKNGRRCWRLHPWIVR